MKRRQFVFGSLKAAALLSPVLSLRRVDAAEGRPSRAFVWVNCCGYPTAEDFFPSGGERDFTLSPILADFEPLRNDMIVVDGIDIRNSGLNPKGNDHIRSVGKVLTAKDVLRAPDAEDGLPGGWSVDQLIAGALSLPSLELSVNDFDRAHMRYRPFATGAGVFKPALANPVDAWNRVFRDIVPSEDPAEAARRRRHLLLRRSMLDDLTAELGRFRRELDGVERLKLDVHEDAIRRAEQSIARDIEEDSRVVCEVPGSPDASFYVPTRAQAHLDLAFAALSCGRANVLSMVWGFSGYHWKYEWAGVGGVRDSGHDEIHHLAGSRRADYVRMARWDWNHLRGLVQRLKETPEGSGTMLDDTLVLGISHFGRHHDLRRIPAVLFGNAKGQLTTGRYVRLPETQHNDKLLTSVAQLMGVPVDGIGDDPTCGPLPQLMG